MQSLRPRLLLFLNDFFQEFVHRLLVAPLRRIHDDVSCSRHTALRRWHRIFRNIDAATTQGLPVAEFEAYRWKETPAISSGSNGSIALMNQGPHPNAARVFINWLLSRDGQVSFQKVMNSADLLVESMRVDIAKDPIPAPQRRVAGMKYIIMDTPERSNQEPVNKLLKEIIKK